MSHQHTKKSRNVKKILGGDIVDHSILKNIKSIGFEIETVDLIKLTKTKHEKKTILVNSALTNADLEEGYIDEDEYTYIIDEPAVKFKITNDSVEDTELNEVISQLIEKHNTSDTDVATQCDNVIFKLKVPKAASSHIKGGNYDIYVRETDLSLTKCSIFTDTEWIITYYKPAPSKNLIMDMFTQSMKHIKSHIDELVTIPNAQMLVLGEKNQYEKFTQINNTDQIYVLPNTSLVYLSSAHTPHAEKYDIQKDIRFVVQMTFSTHITNVFKMMKQIMSVDYFNSKHPKMRVLEKYLSEKGEMKQIKEMRNIMENILSNSNFDINAIEMSLHIVKILFDTYHQKSPLAEKYSFDKTANKTAVQKTKLYLFLIIYKVFVYLNSYLEMKTLDPENMLKKNLSFAIRHSNYVLYLEMKKSIKEIFDIDNNDTIAEIVDAIINDVASRKHLYYLDYIRKSHMELWRPIAEAKKSGDTAEYERLIEKHYGNPLYSLNSYFKHFETPSDREDTPTPNDEEDQEGEGEEAEEVDAEPEEDEEEGEFDEDNLALQSAKRDWLVKKHVDEKSTKFELNDDNIIIEFRDFPTYLYLEMFVSGDEETREKMLEQNMGTITMEIANKFISLNTSQMPTNKHQTRKLHQSPEVTKSKSKSKSMTNTKKSRSRSKSPKTEKIHPEPPQYDEEKENNNPF